MIEENMVFEENELIPFVGVDYEEYDCSSYNGVFVWTEDKRMLFNSGEFDIEKDYNEAMKYVIETLGAKHIHMSSSWDQFFQDLDPCDDCDEEE